MAYRQGSVVLGPDLFKSGLRPFFIISNEDRPFRGESYTVAVMSTTPREEAVAIVPGEDIEAGRLNKRSYINVWALHTIRDEDINRRVAQVDPSTAKRACQLAKRYIEYRGGE